MTLSPDYLHGYDPTHPSTTRLVALRAAHDIEIALIASGLAGDTDKRVLERAQKFADFLSPPSDAPGLPMAPQLASLTGGELMAIVTILKDGGWTAPDAISRLANSALAKLEAPTPSDASPDVLPEAMMMRGDD